MPGVWHHAQPHSRQGLSPVPARALRADSPGWAERVLTRLDRDADETVATLSELVRIPSIGGSEAEHEIQARLAASLAGHGFDVDHWPVPLGELLAAADAPGTEVPRTQAWGLVARLPGLGSGAGLMIDAHVDVVPPGAPDGWSTAGPWSGHVQGDARLGRLFGRGSVDMKAGLAASIAALLAIRRVGVPLRRAALLACVQGEEDGGLGTYATLRRGHRASACVVPEPTGLDVVPACAGALTFRLIVPGRSTHAARRTDGVSALEAFWPIHRALAELEGTRNRAVHPLMRGWPVPYPLSIGTVRAGDWASTVPGSLVAEGRLGVALDESPDTARKAFETAVTEACADDRWLTEHPVTVEWWGGQFAPGLLDEGSDLVVSVSDAHRQALPSRDPPQVYGVPYGSDLRLLTAAGVPTVLYGPGDAVQAHAPDESVALADVHDAARTLALLTLELCGPGV